MAQTPVTTTPVKIAENGARSGVDPSTDDAVTKTYVISERAGTGTVYLSKTQAGATVANGTEWRFGSYGPFVVQLEAGEQLWAATASGSVSIDNVLALGR